MRPFLKIFTYALTVSLTKTNLLNWAQETNRWPLVLKPPRSAGGEGVYLCKDLKEVKAAFQAIYGKTNSMANFNDMVFAEPYFEGFEYGVNGASSNGSLM